LGADDQPRRELFSEDDLHLNERGYELWACAIQARLPRLMGGVGPGSREPEHRPQP